MIYVYRHVNSNSARDLAESLQGRRIRNFERVRVRPDDAIVCWGERLPPPTNGGRVLNGGPLSNKFEDAVRLRQENVRTIEVVRGAPRHEVVDVVTPLRNRAANEAGFIAEALRGHRDPLPLMHQLTATVTEMNRAAARPAPQAAIWLPRVNGHIGGNDLLNPPARPDFFVKKEEFVSEFRVHSFLGRSIHAGIKRPSGPAPQHPWIRSYDAGWRIHYDGNSVRQAHRDVAHRACVALGLDFGAVDIGQKADGTLVVLEVNRAPGVEGGTLAAYTQAIRGWAEGRTPPARRPRR